MKKQCGIYKIVNKINNKIYIGSSFDIKTRWMNHRYLLNSNQHHSVHLQHAWNKYGSNNFEFIVLELCSIENLLLKEQTYLNDLLKADLFLLENNNFFLENGYNIKCVAGSNIGFKYSKETIKEIKNKLFLKVYAIDVNGIILKEFDTTGDAAKYFNIAINRVQLSTKNKKCIKNANYGFLYIKDWFEGYKPIQVEAWMKNTKGLIKNTNKKAVYVYDIDGNFIEKIESQLECCNKYNINPCNLVRSLNEKIRLDRLFNRRRKFIFRRNSNDETIKTLQKQIN